MKNSINPLVAIQCLVYNHEPYLADCLNGFVTQRTTFPFVAVVHDDASTDNSASIIREFAEKYPNIIIPIYETENQWRKPDGSLSRIMNKALDATGAKYIAICEGDDYWTDPYKLQKQIDILEADNTLMACVTNTSRVDKEGNLLEAKQDNVVQGNREGKYSIYDFFKTPQHSYPTATVVYRSYNLTEIRRKFRHTENPFLGDWTLWIILHSYGAFYYLDEVTAAYRVNPTSLTHTVNRVARAKASADICRRVADVLQDRYADIAENLRDTRWTWIPLMFAYRAEKKYVHMLGCAFMALVLCPGSLWNTFKSVMYKRKNK